ncbi:GNAT family N-acetyltransferase [Empedobacter brevis]|uniref:GNAT family N-acetyltransferase n=1 Tax=Empedobacter brevis TaxID=247 RepID=UPI0039B03CE9
MYLDSLQLKELCSERLILIPFTISICKNILENNYTDLEQLNLVRGNGWPDEDMVETLPRIMNNLSKIDYLTGFESWMIVKKSSREVIGDVGFKGYNFVTRSCDIGYGIIEAERKKGFASEAAAELINWAFSKETLEEITACCLIENIDSIKLLKRLNFTEIDRDSTTIYWSLLRENRLS